MLNGLIVFAAVSAVLLAAFAGQMQALTDSIVSSADGAVDLAIGLVGLMAFFLGLMRVAEDAGLLRSLARALGPVMQRLFPNVPADSPAMSAMILNIAANMLGLGNAATPFGIKAMEELNKLNSKTGTATNAMALFLAMNTSALAILPSGVVSLRASVGSADAVGIFLPTWFASGCATIVGVSAAVLLSRLPFFARTEPPLMEVGHVDAAPDAGDAESMAGAGAPPVREPLAGRQWWGRLFWLALTGLLVRFVLGLRGETPLAIITAVSGGWMLPTLVVALMLYGWVRGVRVYDSLAEGAKQGFQVAIRVIPYLVAILVVIGMFRASGGIALIAGVIAPITALVGMPPEVLPMALLRPLSGQGAFGVLAETMTAYGPDSLIGYMVSTFQGSTETTFYTLAVYYGAVGIRDTRHTVPACLLADITGILAGVFIVNLMFG
jgi:spore maturation protein SpmA